MHENAFKEKKTKKPKKKAYFISNEHLSEQADSNLTNLSHWLD